MDMCTVIAERIMAWENEWVNPPSNGPTEGVAPPEKLYPRHRWFSKCLVLAGSFAYSQAMYEMARSGRVIDRAKPKVCGHRLLHCPSLADREIKIVTEA